MSHGDGGEVGKIMAVGYSSAVRILKRGHSSPLKTCVEFDPVSNNRPHGWRHGFERKRLDPWHDSKDHWEPLWVDSGHLCWRMVVVLVVFVAVGGSVEAVEARLRLCPLVYPLESQRMVSRCLERSWDHF